MQNRTHTDAATGTTPSFDDVQAGVDDLTGIYPAIDKILDGITDLAGLQATPERTAAALTALAGHSDGSDVIGLLTAVMLRLTDQAANPGLVSVPAARQHDVRERVQEFAAYVRDFLPRDLVTWTTWDLDPTSIPA